MAGGKRGSGEKTSKTIAKKSASSLKSGSAPSKTIAGSALSQSRTSKTTGADAASIAGKKLASPGASKNDKSIAGSVLTQRNRPAGKVAKKTTGSSGTSSGGPSKK